MTGFSTGNGAKFTLAAWVYPTRLDAGQYQFIVYYGNPPAGISGQTPALVITNTAKAWSISTWTAPNDLIGSAARLNQWTHVVGVSDGTRLTLYVNGALDAGPFTMSANAPVAVSAEIGANPDNVLNFFPGKLDDVRVYNRALTGDEVKRLYNLGR